MSNQPAITAPAVSTHEITQDATASVVTASDEQASRGPLPAPENAGLKDAVDAAREPIRPPEPHTLASVAAVPDAATHPVIAVFHPHTSNVITPEVFAKAEENLASYLGHKIDPVLTKDLLLTLSNILSDSPEGRTGGTDLQLCFKGPMIEANFAEMQREVIQALQEHPLIGQILKTNHTLMIDQVSSDEKGQMMHLHLPNLTPEQYTKLMTELASSNHVWKHPHTGEKASPIKDAAYEVVSSAITKEAGAATEPTASVIKDPLTSVPAPKAETETLSAPVTAEVPTAPVPPAPPEMPPVVPVTGPTPTNPAPVAPPPIVEGEHKPKPISTEAPMASIETPAMSQQTVLPAPTKAVGV